MSAPTKPEYTEQEKFWSGEFGDEYTDRNDGADWIGSNAALFARMLRSTEKVGSIIEFGANRGLNLKALRLLLPKAKLAAVEINQKAAAELRKLPDVEVYNQSIFDYSSPAQYDLVLIKGVLIHLNPERLKDAYEILYRSSARYIFLAEYYNPSPVTVSYRGHSDVLFKRDFAGEMLKRYANLRLLDYGFVYRGDPNFPQDDITWFLLEKVAP